MAKKLSTQELKMLLGNMQKPRQQVNAVDNTGRIMPRPEENPASKEAFWMWMNQLQGKAKAPSNMYSSGPEPVYENVGQKVRADLEREQRQRDLHASIPNEKFDTWAENVGMPAADIGMAIDAGINIPKLLLKAGEYATPKLLEALEKNGLNAAEKVSISGVKRNANSPLINNFFRNDRSKGFEKLRGIIQDHERFQPYEKEIIEELKNIEKTESPFYDLNDEWVNEYWNQFKKDINTEEGKKRITSFLNPKDKDRLIKEHGSLDKFLNKFASNSDLTDMRFVLDPFEKGASYNGIGMNQIRINRNLLNKLKSMGQEGKDILNKILEHETQHHIKYILSPDDAFRLTKKLQKLPLDYSMDNLFLNLNMPEELNNFLKNSKWYYENPEEKLPMLSEIRSDLLRKGYIKNRYDKITPKMIEKLHMQENFPTITKSDLYDLNTMAIKSTEKNRLLNILNPRKENYSFLAGKLNKLLGIGGVSIGAPGLLNVLNKSKGNGN